MKNLNTYFKLTGVIALAALLLYTCKKDSTIKTTLIGKWTNIRHYDKAQLLNQTYLFNKDSTVNVSRTVIDSASGSLIGYNYSASGKFSLNGENLKLYQLIAFHDTVANSRYLPLSKLAIFKTDTLETYTMKMNTDGNSFYFYFVCPPNASCSGPLTFTRQ